MAEMLDELIAPCGMNCRLCAAYQRKLRPCLGCRPGPNLLSRRGCKIKNCDGMRESALGFCCNCGDYPCARLKKLDARYRAKYHMSEIENLEYINEHGMEAFLEREEARWICPRCGSVLCVHKEACPICREPYGTATEKTYT